MKTTEDLARAAQAYKDGSQESFTEIYEQSYRYLYACVIHIVKEEETAQDMLQETYLEIIRSIKMLDNAQNFLNWAAVIANRKCFAYLKKNRNLLADDAEGILEEIPDDMALIPEEVMQDKERQRLMREIIDGLSDIQRLCVIGYYYNEQSQESLAEEFGIPVGTVKSHLSRARAKIKFFVEELDVKKGTRLYNVAPLMLLLIEEEAKACILQPISAALASAAGAETVGKVSLFGKLKAVWSKLSAGAKAKAVAGAAGVCTVGIAAAVFLGSQTDAPRISEETKELFDQVMQICEEGNYEDLFELDYSMAGYTGNELHNSVKYGDVNGKQISEMYYDEKNELHYDTWYYDGKSPELKKTLTGYGLNISGSYLAFGYFENGQAVGKCVSFFVSLIEDQASEENLSPSKEYDLSIVLSELNVENGTLVGEINHRHWYGTDASGQPQLNHAIKGNVVPVHVWQKDGSYSVQFFFDGRVEYRSAVWMWEAKFIYLKAACVDERYLTADGEFFDEKRECVIFRYTSPERWISSFTTVISESLLDWESMDFIDVQQDAAY